MPGPPSFCCGVSLRSQRFRSDEHRCVGALSVATCTGSSLVVCIIGTGAPSGTYANFMRLAKPDSQFSGMSTPIGLYAIVWGVLTMIGFAQVACRRAEAASASYKVVEAEPRWVYSQQVHTPSSGSSPGTAPPTPPHVREAPYATPTQQRTSWWSTPSPPAGHSLRFR